MKRRMGRWLGGIIVAGLICAHGGLAAAAAVNWDRVLLSRETSGLTASAAIDDQGEAVTMWVGRADSSTGRKDRVWARARTGGQPWGRRTALSQVFGGRQNDPVVRVSAAGDAIAVWDEADGVWTAERPAQGAWGPARLLVAGAAAPLLVMNARGDAALAWGSGSGLTGATQVNVMRRDAGDEWQAPQVMAHAPSTSGAGVELNDLAIAEHSGEVVAAWESFEIHCFDYCIRVRFVLHASRSGRGGQGWSDSGALHERPEGNHWALVTIEPAGRAGVGFGDDAEGVMFTMQSTPDGAWTPPVSIHRVDSYSFSWIDGLTSDEAGNVTLAFHDTPGAMVMVGSLVTGCWDEPLAVSGTDAYVGMIQLASSPSGAAVLTWTSNNSILRVATRRSSFSAWRRAQTVSPRGVMLSLPRAAAINRTGQAVVVFSTFASPFGPDTVCAATN